MDELEHDGNSMSLDHELTTQVEECGVEPVAVQRGQEIAQHRLWFDNEFLELQNPKTSSGRLLFVFVRRELRNFHIEKLYREAYILNEAYIRGVQQIATGTVILNVSAWLRAVCYRIIRELHREYKKSSSLDKDVPEDYPAISPVDLEDDLATLRIAFQTLPPFDQRLLTLKIVGERSFQEIREILRVEGFGDFSQATLRKRKERSLARLRKKYHAIKPPEFPNLF